MVCKFFCIPAEPGSEDDAATGDMIERGDGLRERDRVVFEGECYRGSQSDGGGDGGGEAERDPGVEGAHVPVVGEGLVAGSGVGGFAPDRDVCVFGHVEAVEAGVFCGFRGGVGSDSPIAREQGDSVAHSDPSHRMTQKM